MQSINNTTARNSATIPTDYELRKSAHELQTRFRIQFHLAAIVLGVKDKPQQEGKIDNRSLRIPEGFVQIISALALMFRVDRKTMKWNFIPERFDEHGWRRTSYNEFRQIKSLEAYCITNAILGYSLRELEKAGVIAREGRGDGLRIRFNARRVIKIIENHRRLCHKRLCSGEAFSTLDHGEVNLVSGMGSSENSDMNVPESDRASMATDEHKVDQVVRSEDANPSLVLPTEKASSLPGCSMPAASVLEETAALGPYPFPL